MKESEKFFKGWHSRGYNPHFDSPNMVQFVTFRLYDSVPKEVIEKWKFELNIDEYNEVEKQDKFQKLIANYEDAGFGACFLKNEKIGEIVEEIFLFFDEKRYNLIVWCIMPNHVHILLKINEDFSLGKIIQSWKSYTAREGNKILNRSGDFWMKGYYDRFIRDEKHFLQVIEYIHNNPVKAKLVEKPEEWERSSAGKK